MANWTTIDPNTLLPGDPWTSSKAQAAFENLEAFAEAAPGSPKLNLTMLLEDLVAGNVVQWREDAELKTSSNGSTIERFGIGFMQEGTVRFSFEHFIDSDGNAKTTQFWRKRRGVLERIESLANTTTPTSRTLDMTVVKGDYYYLTTSSLENDPLAVLRNCRISTTGMRISPFPYSAWEP